MLKDGDVLLYKGTSFISKIIRWKTKSQWSHAGIVAWWGDRLMVLEATGRGVWPVRLSKNIDKYHGDIHWFQYNGVRPLYVADRKAMIEFAKEEIGKEYPSVWELAKTFLGKDNTDDKFVFNRKIIFCSQFVARVYNWRGFDLASKKADDYTTPEDLYAGDLTRVGILKKENKDV